MQGPRDLRSGDALLTKLRENAFLGLLPEDRLAAVARTAREVRLGRRETLFRAGDPGAVLYIVLEGHLKLVRAGPTGRELLLDIAGPGAVFGEIAAIAGLARAADAIAIAPTRLLALDGRGIAAILREGGNAPLAAIRLLAERLRIATDRVEELTFLPTEARLARALIRLASGGGAAPVHLGIALSQSELGELTGITRESINKQLAAWRALGLIGADPAGGIVLLDPGALRAIGGPEDEDAVFSR